MKRRYWSQISLHRASDIAIATKWLLPRRCCCLIGVHDPVKAGLERRQVDTKKLGWQKRQREMVPGGTGLASIFLGVLQKRVDKLLLSKPQFGNMEKEKVGRGGAFSCPPLNSWQLCQCCLMPSASAIVGHCSHLHGGHHSAGVWLWRAERERVAIVQAHSWEVENITLVHFLLSRTLSDGHT